MFEDIDKQAMLNIRHYLSQVPGKIFFKDTKCRYVMTSGLDDVVDHVKIKQDSLIGRTDLEIQHDKEFGKECYQTDLRVMATGETVTMWKETVVGDKVIYSEVVKKPIWDRDYKKIVGVVGIVNDVTELATLSRKLEERAMTDDMTRLFNRDYLEQWKKVDYNKAIYPVSVIIASCNGIREINEKLGHDAGDDHIILAANLFRRITKKEQKCIRTGLDEFMIICENTNEAKAADIINRINSAEKEYVVHGKQLSVSFSCSTIEKDNSDLLEELINQASKKKYKKREGNSFI